MNHLDLVRGFQEFCDSGSPSPQQLAAEFRKRIEPLGFRHFACCSHVNPGNPPPETVILHNYPPGWVRTFTEAGLYEVDPVFRRAESNRVPFFWDLAFPADRLTPPQSWVLAEAASYGLAHGYTVPLHSSWLPGSFRASCSVIPDSASVDPASYVAIELLAKYLYLFASRAHEAWLAAPSVELSLRERQCLALVAQGKTDWAIGRILEISQSTAHFHIEGAKRRIGVTTRQQAVTYAYKTGQLSGPNSSCTPGRCPTRRSALIPRQLSKFRAGLRRSGLDSPSLIS